MKPTRGPRRQDSSKNPSTGRTGKPGVKKGADAKTGRGRDDKSTDRKAKKDADKKDEKVIWLLELRKGKLLKMGYIHSHA